MSEANKYPLTSQTIMINEERHTYHNVSAPHDSAINSQFVSVMLRDDEIVNWNYGMTNGKTYITGYTITKKTPKN